MRIRAAPRIFIRLLVWSRSGCIRLIHRTSADPICDEGMQEIRPGGGQAAVAEQRLLGSYGVSIDRREPEAGGSVVGRLVPRRHRLGVILGWPSLTPKA